MAINILVTSVNGLIWDKVVDEVVLPSKTGQIGVLEGHTPLVTALEIGVLRFKIGEKWTPTIALGGFATILNNEVTVLLSGVEEVIPGQYEEAVESLKQVTKEFSILVNDQSTDKDTIFAAGQMVKCAAALVDAYKFLT
jgi:F-type H+-transporting ATPase subunit epsilon